MPEEIIKYSFLISLMATYSSLLTLITFICITYIIRLRSNSVCRKCKLAFDRESVPLKSNVIEPEKTVDTKLNLEDQNENKNLSPMKTRKKLPLPDAEVPLEIHHYEEIMNRIKTQLPELYERVIEPLQKAIRESIKVENTLYQINSDQVQCSDMPSHTNENVISNKFENANDDILVDYPKRITNYNLKGPQPSNSKTSPQKIALDSEAVPLKSNVKSEITVHPKLNLGHQNENQNLSPLKTRKKLALPVAEVPLEIQHYEEIMDRIKNQQPELYERVLEPLQKAIRGSIKIDNQFRQSDSTDQVQSADMLNPTYDEEIYNDTYDIFVNAPKRIPNHNLKNLQPSSSESSQNKINETLHLEAKQNTPSKDCPQKIVYDRKTSVEPEKSIQRKFNLDSENINEKTSPLKTRKKLALMPDYSKKCRKKRDEMEAPLKEHHYEEIVDTEKTRQSEFYYKAVMEQLQRTMSESTKTDSIEQGQYCDMLSHTYEKMIYNNPEKADFKIPKRSASFRTSFGMKDHLKYLQPSSSHTSEDDINETTYLEAKQFIPTEDCPQKLRSLCSLQNQDEIEEKATSWRPPTRIRTRSESSKGFIDFFLKIKK